MGLAGFLLFLLITFCLLCKLKYFENWVDYVQLPYKYVKEGSDPIHYYRRDRFRKPYRYGTKFQQSYPYSHYEPYP